MARINSSMQLTRAADYGVRVMIALACAPTGKRQSLSSLAKSADAPESFLSKVLQSLVRAGLVDSRRGQSGGFEIAPAGRAATIRNIIEAIDGPVRLNICLLEGRPCHRQESCPAHPVWSRAQEAMFAVLDEISVNELAGQPKSASQERNGDQLIYLS